MYESDNTWEKFNYTKEYNPLSLSFFVIYTKKLKASWLSWKSKLK